MANYILTKEWSEYWVIDKTAEAEVTAESEQEALAQADKVEFHVVDEGILVEDIDHDEFVVIEAELMSEDSEEDSEDTAA